MDALIEVEDEDGRKLEDEDIIDVLIMYLNAGHESSGHITMWATVFLQEHPECFRKAKVPRWVNHLRSPSSINLRLSTLLVFFSFTRSSIPDSLLAGRTGGDQEEHALLADRVDPQGLSKNGVSFQGLVGSPEPLNPHQTQFNHIRTQS